METLIISSIASLFLGLGLGYWLGINRDRRIAKRMYRKYSGSRMATAVPLNTTARSMSAS